MNKSSIVFLTLSALALGTLIGIGFVGSSSDKPDQVIPNLMSMESSTKSISTGGAPVFRYFEPIESNISLDEFGRPTPSVIGENFISRDGSWKSETLSIEIPVDGAIEYKAIMQRGDSIVFDWSANGSAVYSDFHGHDASYGNDFFVRYETTEQNSQAGMIVAAFEGGHGWYWLNLDDEPATITLRVSGFFEEIVKLEVDI